MCIRDRTKGESTRKGILGRSRAMRTAVLPEVEKATMTSAPTVSASDTVARATAWYRLGSVGSFGGAFSGWAMM